MLSSLRPSICIPSIKVDTYHLVKEFQRCYLASWGPGHNYKARGSLKTPRTLFFLSRKFDKSLS